MTLKNTLKSDSDLDTIIYSYLTGLYFNVINMLNEDLIEGNSLI